MSDVELSDINDEDDIIRQHQNNDDDNENQDNGMQENDQNASVEDGEVKADNEDFEAKRVDPKKKRGTRKMVVLNTERLKGSKGIHTIEKLYEGFKFQGKGHEKEDLDRVMKRLEYWAYRIFPKLDFDDFLDKCEHLGHKKDLQTHLKKYRLGMITSDFNALTQNDIIEDEEREDDTEIPRTESELRTEIADDEFQRLFDEMESTALPNP